MHVITPTALAFDIVIMLERVCFSPYQSVTLVSIPLFPVQRGKKVPEGLTSADDIGGFLQIASHPVSHSDQDTDTHCVHVSTSMSSVYL